MSDDDDKPSERDTALQRYFDGEMPVEERAAFERSLTDEDQQRLAALAEVGAVLQSALEAEAADVDLWPTLAAKLAGEPAPSRTQGRGKVVPLPARRRVRATLWATATGLAAAAAVTLMLYLRTSPSSNNCDVETLETEGTVATVLQLGEANNNAVTVIWTEEN